MGLTIDVTHLCTELSPEVPWLPLTHTTSLLRASNFTLLDGRFSAEIQPLEGVKFHALSDTRSVLSGLPYGHEEFEGIANRPLKIRDLEWQKTQFFQTLGHGQEMPGRPNSAVRVDILSQRTPTAEF
jgi:hypothetical protein